MKFCLLTIASFEISVPDLFYRIRFQKKSVSNGYFGDGQVFLKDKIQKVKLVQRIGYDRIS